MNRARLDKCLLHSHSLYDKVGVLPVDAVKHIQKALPDVWDNLSLFTRVRVNGDEQTRDGLCMVW